MEFLLSLIMFSSPSLAKTTTTQASYTVMSTDDDGKKVDYSEMTTHEGLKGIVCRGIVPEEKMSDLQMKTFKQNSICFRFTCKEKLTPKKKDFFTKTRLKQCLFKGNTSVRNQFNVRYQVFDLTQEQKRMVESKDKDRILDLTNRCQSDHHIRSCDELFTYFRKSQSKKANKWRQKLCDLLEMKKSECHLLDRLQPRE